MKYGKHYGGRDPRLIEEDIFQIIVYYPPYQDKYPQKAHDKAHDEAHVVLSSLDYNILKACYKEPQSTSELLSTFGYNTRTGNFKKALTKLKKHGYLVFTIPASPKSKKQKYRLTNKGMRYLQKK